MHSDDFHSETHFARSAQDLDHPNPFFFIYSGSLRSRRLEVVGTRKNGRARRRHACLPRARPFSLSPATSKRLLRRLLLGTLNSSTVKPRFTDTSLLRTVCVVPWERKPRHQFSLNSTRLIRTPRLLTLLNFMVPSVPVY